MKEVTIFEATDGKQFTTKERCLEYEGAGCVEFYPLPDYGDHVPIDKAAHWMLSGDGYCYYATATKMSRLRAHRGIRASHPAWATHLIYFGK